MGAGPARREEGLTATPESKRSQYLELAASAGVLLFCAWLGTVTGWKGRPKTAISTEIWPFYLDTWFGKPVFTWRALIPLALIPLVVVAARVFVKRGHFVHLLLLCICAYAFALACGVVRHGVPLGLEFTFLRAQEYWNDVRFVHDGVLARFPEVGGTLSQHGATHPPGLILLLAGVQALGAQSRVQAELVCSLAAPLSALPLYGAARRLTDEETGRFATALFLSACSVTAFTILAMDLVTMLLAAIALYGLSRALYDDGMRGLVGGVIWGLALAAASLCTFTALILSLGFALLILVRWKALDSRRWLALALGPIAFFAFYAILVLGFGYRPLHVLQANWVAFARSDDAHRSHAVALLGNPVAFLGSLGLPLMGLYAHAFGSAVKRARSRAEPSTSATVALMIAAALGPLTCTLLGKPRAEVERIYLLFVPLVAIAAAAAARRWYARDARWLYTLALPVALLQSIAVEVFTETLW